MHVFIGCFLLVIIGVVIRTIWGCLAKRHFTTTLLSPGMVFQVQDRVYQIPSSMSVQGDAYLLKENVLRDLRELFRRSAAFLNSCSLDWWISGGTLLGAVRNGAIPLPFDDDLDVHMNFSDKERVLEALKARGAAFSIELSPMTCLGKVRLTSVLRLVLPKTQFPVMDIFFTKMVGSSMIGKVDSWGRGNVVINRKEQWPLSDVFPLTRNCRIDGLLVNLPANPESVLKRQFGRDCLTKIVARRLNMSHHLPMKALQFFFGYEEETSNILMEFILWCTDVVTYTLCPS